MKSIGFGVCLLLSGTDLPAQSAVSGSVIHDSTRAPMAGAEALIQDVRRSVVTNGTGLFLIDNLAPGWHTILVRQVGFRPVLVRALLIPNDTLRITIALRPMAVELPPIEVTASAVPFGMETFEERRRIGHGHFIDSKVLRKSEHQTLTNLLGGVPGVSIRWLGDALSRGVNARYYVSSSRDPCPMQIYLNQVRVFEQPRRGQRRVELPPDANMLITIAELEAIEVYRSAAETPLSLGGPSAWCGTLVLWTRRR